MVASETQTGVRSATPLRIAGVDPERGFAGGETQVLGLTLELLDMGHRAELLCDSLGELWRRANAAGIRCHPLPIRNALDLSAGAELRRLLRASRYDVVHFHTARAHAMAPWARGCARAAVVTRRMDYVPNRLFAPYLFGRAVDGVAAISAGVADALAQAGVSRERVTVIPSGVDCAHFRPPSPDERAQARAALKLGDADMAVGAVGALEPRKGHRYLLEAMALLRREGVSGGPGAAAHAFIAGNGTLARELAADVQGLGLCDTVRMMGQVADTREMLWALDIFAMPSLKEGLGVAVLEAMACGLATVASRAGGIVDAIDDGHSGTLLPPGDARVLADALAALMTDPIKRLEMGRTARSRALERFSMTAMARRTVELYRSCLQTDSSESHEGARIRCGA
jgi:glycosyltransferase involved in cell wall biosynthesis